MIKLPDKIKVGAHDVTIKYPYKFTERFDQYAQCDNGLDEIKIQVVDAGGMEFPELPILVSLMHELYHRIDNITGHLIFNNKEEAVVGHSEMMIQVLLDNPEFVRLFLDDWNTERSSVMENIHIMSWDFLED